MFSIALDTLQNPKLNSRQKLEVQMEENAPNVDPTHSEISNERLELKVTRTLQRLTVNLMRIAAGTGSLYEIEDQVHTVAQALLDYRKATGVGVDPAAFDEALGISRQYDFRGVQDELYARQKRAELQTICGALGVAAWHLAGRPQGRTTHEKLEDGAAQMSSLREEFRKA